MTSASPSSVESQIIKTRKLGTHISTLDMIAARTLWVNLKGGVCDDQLLLIMLRATDRTLYCRVP